MLEANSLMLNYTVSCTTQDKLMEEIRDGDRDMITFLIVKMICSGAALLQPFSALYILQFDVMKGEGLPPSTADHTRCTDQLLSFCLLFPFLQNLINGIVKHAVTPPQPGYLSPMKGEKRRGTRRLLLFSQDKPCYCTS